LEQVLFGGYPNDLPTVTTEYNTLIGGYIWYAIELHHQKVISTKGTLKRLIFVLSGSPGAGKKYTFTLMLNGYPTTLTLEIADDATSGSDLVHEIEIVGGDTVSLRCDPDGTPTARYATWPCIFESDKPNESLIMGGSYDQANPAATEYGQVMGAYTAYNTIESNFRQVVPTSGTIKTLYVRLTSDPGTAPDAYRFTLRKGPAGGPQADTALTVTIVANDKYGFDLVHTVPVDPGDVLTMKIEPLNDPSGVPRCRWGMTFLADIDGESIVLGGTHNNLPQTATEYNLLTCREANTWTATESNRYQLGQVCTLKKLYFLLAGSPGSGNKYDFTLRVGGVGGTVVTTIADLAYTGNSGALEDTVADGEYVNLRVVPTSSPTVRDSYWGFVCYIVPLAVIRRFQEEGTDFRETKFGATWGYS